MVTKQNISHRLKLAVGTAILSFGLFNIHSRCSITEGSALGHDWLSATCLDPKTCDRCGLTGEARHHDAADVQADIAETVD